MLWWTEDSFGHRARREIKDGSCASTRTRFAPLIRRGTDLQQAIRLLLAKQHGQLQVGRSVPVSADDLRPVRHGEEGENGGVAPGSTFNWLGRPCIPGMGRILRLSRHQSLELQRDLSTSQRSWLRGREGSPLQQPDASMAHEMSK
jgi:hypothetical protein